MALTGKPISAADAVTHGLVNRLAAPGQVLEAALELARTITANSPAAVEATRRLVYESLDLSEEDFWPAQAPVIEQVFASDDAREGARAFAEKRAPRWTGR
jgi:enoyl-CoA hydratase